MPWCTARDCLSWLQVEARAATGRRFLLLSCTHNAKHSCQPIPFAPLTSTWALRTGACAYLCACVPYAGTGVTIVHEGECGSRVFPDGDEGEVGEYCLCYTDEFDPVCGKDGERPGDPVQPSVTLWAEAADPQPDGDRVMACCTAVLLLLLWVVRWCRAPKKMTARVTRATWGV